MALAGSPMCDLHHCGGAPTAQMGSLAICPLSPPFPTTGGTDWASDERPGLL